MCHNPVACSTLFYLPFPESSPIILNKIDSPRQLTWQVFNGLRSGDWVGHVKALKHFCVDLDI